MKLRKIVKDIAGTLALISALALFWSCAYWFTTWLYDYFGYTPSAFAKQLITSLLGFILFGFCMFLITNIKWVKNHQDKMLLPIVHAMKMMAEGNFNIDLSYYQKMKWRDREHPYAIIIENVREMAKKLGEMEEMRQEFISNVSHEIQSPLTSISGFAHALKNDTLSQEERAHYLNIIEMESVRLSKLSDNLLKLTSLESDELAFDEREYRLDYQLRRIILANEPQWAEKEIQMNISLEEVTVTGNEDLLDQVWINLLHNSIKFTPEKGMITVAASKDEDGTVMVRIKDTGIGMDQHALLHIFERFYKADPSRNHHAGGNGLGLAIVKKIIDLHQGSIRVQSELGNGTEITVILK